MPQVLATFLHLSDLHVGEIDQGSGDAVLPAALQASYRHQTWLDGLLGHESQALEELDAFIETELRAQGVEPVVIVTGDLSRAGSAASLRLAREFVEDEIALSPPASRWAGLRAGPVDLMVAGNHDHWGGSAPPPGGAPSVAWATLFGTPAAPSPILPMRTLANGRRMAFLRIDSDADVAPRTPYRALAIGDFLSELQRFPALPPPTPDDIRVLLIHHSWTQSGIFLRMSQRSKLALGEFLFDNRVCAILTGHSHTPSLLPFLAHGNGVGSRTVYELRCGTSAQYSSLPKSWFYGASRALQTPRPPNTLLLHRIVDTGRGTAWQATVYERSVPTGPFLLLQHSHAALTFPI